MSKWSASLTAAAVYCLSLNYAVHVSVWWYFNDHHISSGFSAHTVISREPYKSTVKPSWLSAATNDVNQIISTIPNIEWRLIAIAGALEMQRRRCEGECRGGCNELSFILLNIGCFPIRRTDTCVLVDTGLCCDLVAQLTVWAYYN